MYSTHSYSHPGFSRTPYFIGLLCLALIVLTSCKNSTDLQTEGETYIRGNITELSPRSAVLGGTFRVTDIEWEDENTALITYEDGHIQLRGRTDVTLDGNAVTATRIRIDTSGDTSSSSTSDSDDTSSASSTSSSMTSGSNTSGSMTSASSQSSTQTSTTTSRSAMSVGVSAGMSAGMSVGN